ncbi:MAG: cupin domain-containing protein [Elusimicrobia bacterium]|nr:cupin domain-containing protein [Elusimicrobiota bacterium]
MRVLRKKCAFQDVRGKITDILEKEIIEYVTIITSKKGAVRGNHYHKKSIQYAYILSGKIKLVTQMPGKKVENKIVKPGDLVINIPTERHTLVALENSEFLVLTRGPRGGGNYENDTYRLEKKIA